MRRQRPRPAPFRSVRPKVPPRCPLAAPLFRPASIPAPLGPLAPPAHDGDTALRSGAAPAALASPLASPLLLGLTLTAIVAVLPQAAFAQARGVVERNLPPIVAARAPRSGRRPRHPGRGRHAARHRPHRHPPHRTRRRPSPPSPAPRPLVHRIEGVPAARLDAALKPFLGKPLSPQARRRHPGRHRQTYRGAGRPFVSVTAPPQEVTSGVLQLRVVPSRPARVTVADPAKAAATDAGLAASVRAPQVRSSRPTRSPKTSTGSTAIPTASSTASSSPAPPPAPATSPSRSPAPSPGRLMPDGPTPAQRRPTSTATSSASAPASRRSTTSPSPTSSPAAATPLQPRLHQPLRHDWPSNVSQAGASPCRPSPASRSRSPRASSPQPGRAGGLLTFQNTTFELPILYRSRPVEPVLVADRLGEIYGGVTPRWLSRKTWYQGTDIAEGSAGVFDLVAGWAGSWDHAEAARPRSTSASSSIPAASSRQHRRTWETFSNGRVTSAEYAYIYTRR